MPLLNAPLTTSGALILDSAGKAVRLAGVNWAGASQDGLVPAGLDKLHRDTIAGRIAGWGFNHVRLPFAVGTFMTNSGALRAGPADTARLAANPDLAGLSPWQVYQACVTSLTAHGLAVIPNQHLLHEGWCCSEADCNGLWWNSNWPATTFQACWQLVAEEFASVPLVIGYDLHNEPRKTTAGGVTYTPSWGDGNPQTDLRQMYASTITALRTAEPGKLFFCEGLNYAADLSQAGAHPVGTGPGTCYSLHDYPWFNHPSGQSQADYFAQMDAAGGYLAVQNKAPLWIGEFGTDLGKRANMSGGWTGNILAYLAARDLHWCWWQLSAQSVLATEPCTNAAKAADGDRESYGLMQGQDWLGGQSEMITILTPLMP